MKGSVERSFTHCDGLFKNLWSFDTLAPRGNIIFPSDKLWRVVAESTSVRQAYLGVFLLMSGGGFKSGLERTRRVPRHSLLAMNLIPSLGTSGYHDL